MATKTTDDAKTDEAAAGGGKKKLIIIVVPVVLVLLGAVWFFFLRGGGDAAAAGEAGATPTPTSTHVAGAVVHVDPITINLAGAHYLKLGLGLQQDASVGEESVDGAKALDHAISLFSGMAIDELSTEEGRQAAKAELTKEITEAYEGEVYEVYFTEFVFQ